MLLRKVIANLIIPSKRFLFRIYYYQISGLKRLQLDTKAISGLSKTA